MSQKRDYYEVLGVSKSATDDEIKKAYRNLAKKHHPDVNQGDNESETKFKEANEAYETLRDSQKRAKYDQFGHDGPYQNAGFEGGFGGVDLGDIFESFFSGGSQRRRGPARGNDLKFSMTITFNEAAFGAEKEISLNKYQKCSTCKGTGAKPGTSAETCRHCGGTGQVKTAQRTPFGQFSSSRACDVCHGEGKIIKEPCTQCRGAGKEKKQATIKVNIPSGINDGETISLRGEGEPGEKGGPAGDLYLTMRVKQHEIFKREGYDVYCYMPITFVQATLGDEIEVPTLYGKVKYNMPEGTQTGTKFRLRGKGINNLRGSGKGDQYVIINVEIPKKLNSKQKEMLKEFAKISGNDVHSQRKKFLKKVKDVFGI